MTTASSHDPETPRWTRWCLIAAGIYNLGWGLFVIVSPHTLFDWTGTERLNHPEIWQCVGMVIGVYGIGYLAAARNPYRHWPIILVGFLGKLLGPLGFLFSWARGQLPASWGWLILTNDLVWLPPFATILGSAIRERWRSLPARCRLVWESRIAAMPEEVFRYHEHPRALTWLIPPWESVRPIVPPKSLDVGTRVVLENRLGPIRLRWVALHTELEPPHLFADRQESGPFAFWYHRHRFLDDGQGGTILRDEVEYQLPGGKLAELLFGTWVRSKLERMFRYRHDVTRRMIESGSWRDVSAESRAIV